MLNKIYSYGRQTIEEDDIKAVIDVLRSDWLTQGPKVEEFEELLNRTFGSDNCIAVSNGTAGLHLIGIALGWGKDDLVITTPITFLASANCAIYCGASVDFVDIDQTSYTIDVNKLEDKLKYYRELNIKVSAVVAVDYAGHPCNWEKLKELSNEFGFKLINDFCHALGAEYNEDLKYGIKYADAVNLSFHPVKHITTGEGGAVLTNDSGLATKIRTFRTHGIIKDEKILEKNDGPWYYEMPLPGFNYRLTDMQSALGISQLRKLNRFINRRREVAEYYDKVFGTDERFIIPKVAENVKHAYHLYPLRINFDIVKKSKEEIFLELREKNIYCQVHYIPLHLQPYFRDRFGFIEGDFPIAEKFYKEEISIPIYPSLDDSDLTYISEQILEIIK